jgi:hypothetical protein
MAGIDDRRRILAAMPMVELRPEHVANCRVLPSRELLLGSIPSGGIGAEVGVAFGDFTRLILDINRPEQLHLIDAWETERYRRGLAKIKTDLAGEMEMGKVFIHQGYSTDKLEEFDDGFFDWLYIDTNHSYETTARELEIGARKTRLGGRLLGHDFCTGNPVKPVLYGVIQACNEFCVERGWQYEYLTLESDGHFSFCLKCL